MQTPKNTLQAELHNLPQTWKLTPTGKKDSSGEVNPKAPYLADWAGTDIDREFISTEIEAGRATGYGLIMGRSSGYLVAIDFDGQSAIELGLEKFGELPKTVTWTSGRPGRYQALFSVPEQYRDLVKNKAVKTGVIGDDGKAEQLEFRYTGNQSVLPPSPHPETDGYHWINSPIDTPVAELPQVVIDFWLSLLAPKVTAKPRAKTKLDSEAYTIPPIPLKDCLAKSNRQLLRGVSEGGRNHAGATLARDTIGAANYLDEIGIAYEGDPRGLFDDFCQNCEPPIDDSEADVIWKSAEGDNPEPSCTSEGIDNIIKSWVLKNDPELTLSDDELRQNLKESLDLRNGKAPILFGGELGNLLSIAAGNFNIPVEILNFCLLPILGSRIDARTRLMINPGTNFKVPAIVWCALVGDTGSKKSPIISLLTDPLSRQQIELYDEYKEKKLDYDAEFTNWKNQKPADRGEQPVAPAPMLDLYFSDFTIEAIVDSLQHHPNDGSLVMLDELAQFYQSLDMYRGGKGSDRQKWLTIWNGSGLKNNRKTSGTIVIPQTAISILGGIQPETITNMVSGDNSQFDGFWNRFKFSGLPQFKTSAFTETPADLGIELDKVYRALSRPPHQTHCLSLESKPLWEAWHNETEDKTLSGSSGLVKGTYAKFHGIAARNALIIHRTLAAINGCEPEQLISADVLSLALKWTKWELSQTLLQYQLLGLTNDPELSRILKFIDKFTGKGWVSTSDVRAWWSNKSDRTVENIRKFMAKVVSLGYAIDNDQPSTSSKYQILISSESARITRKTSETYTDKELQMRADEPAKYSTETPEPNGTSVGAHTGNDARKVARKIDSSINDDRDSGGSENAGKSAGIIARNPETAQNGHPIGFNPENAGNDARIPKYLHSNGFGDDAGNTGTFPKNIFKIGDRAKLGDDIFTVNLIEDDFIGGYADDGSYIGGNINSVQSIDVDKSAPTPNGYTTKETGNGFKEIISNRSNNTEAGEIEYDC
jgi:Protein of unknown function (DUF3987)/Bifunctional DNA primase/polymerase, N-terminal